MKMRCGNGFGKFGAGRQYLRRRSALYAMVLGLILCLPIMVRGQSVLSHAVAAKPLETVQHRHAAIITITGSIDRITWVSVQRRIATALKHKSSILIFQINSRAGQLREALKIAALIRHSHVATVAWVNRAALGPAAIIAAACTKVVMSGNAAWGDGQSFALRGADAAKIAADPMAKVSSPALASLQKDHANHPELILAGMMDRKIQIDEIVNKMTGETQFFPPEVRAKLMRLTAAVPGRAAIHPWVYVKRVKHAGTLLTLGAREAVQMGAASAVIHEPESLPAMLNITAPKIPVLRMDFLEKASRFCSRFQVRFFLLIIMLVCGYMEFSHPGLLIPGVIGLVALALFLGGPMLTGLANWWEVGIIFLGIVIIALDFIHFGGLGLLAIPGFILAIIGMIASFVPMGASAVGAEKAFQTGLGVVTLAIVAAGVVIALLIKFLDITPGFRRLQLRPVSPSLRHDTSPGTLGDLLFVGAVGRAVSELRPSGKARFDNHLVTVVSRNEFIAPELPVEIVEIRENQIIVQKISDDGAPVDPAT
ncbi:MAG: NfeD family protein [Phycisphaerae bacterium]